MFESIYLTCVSLGCNINKKSKPNAKSKMLSLPNAPCSIPTEKRRGNKTVQVTDILRN